LASRGVDTAKEAASKVADKGHGKLHNNQIKFVIKEIIDFNSFQMRRNT
jgi:hypothetical protein